MRLFTESEFSCIVGATQFWSIEIFVGRGIFQSLLKEFRNNKWIEGMACRKSRELCWMDDQAAMEAEIWRTGIVCQRATILVDPHIDCREK